MNTNPSEFILSPNEEIVKCNTTSMKDKCMKLQTLKFVGSIMVSFTVLTMTSSRALSVEAKSTESFIDSIGVVLHLSYTDTAYNNYSSIIKPRLQELGIRHIRDGIYPGDKVAQDKFNDLAKIGIKSTLLMDPRGMTSASEAVEIAKKVSASVIAIEGPNELDMYPQVMYKGNAFPEGLRQFQTELYKAIKSDPKTSNLPVIGPSITKWTHDDIAKLAGISCDKNNLHLYPGSTWIPEQPDLDLYFIPNVKPICGKSKPSIATEMGYHTNFQTTPPGYPDGVPEAISAKYISRFILKNFNREIERSFIYQLIDMDTNPEFGLLRNNGSPKPAFIALRNLITILKNPVTTNLRTSRSIRRNSELGNSSNLHNFKNRRIHSGHTKKMRTLLQNSLNFKLVGDTSGIEYTLLNQNDKVFYLILWQAALSFSKSSKQVISVPTKSVKVVLDIPAKKSMIYNPLKEKK
jgi:hypothetical protein